MTILVLSLYLLAVARLTRLINADTILDNVRLRIAGRIRTLSAATDEAIEMGQVTYSHALRDKLGRWNTFFYFIGCPWCVGMWLALFAAPAPILLLRWPLWAVVPVGLAASHLIGLGAQLDNSGEMSVEDDLR